MNRYKKGADLERKAVNDHRRYKHNTENSFTSKRLQKCTRCQKVLSFNMFHKDQYKRLGIRFHCKLCIKKYNNIPIIKLKHEQYRKNRLLDIRNTVFRAYGNKCFCCNESTSEFLTIEHLQGHGRQHKKKLGGQSYFYPWLIKNNFPKEFTILCMNCNFAKGIHGGCPHEKKT